MAAISYQPSKALCTVTEVQGFTVITPTEIHENLERRRFNMVYYYRCQGHDPVQDYLKVAVWVFDAERQRAIVTTAHPVVAIPTPTRWYQGKKRWPPSP